MSNPEEPSLTSYKSQLYSQFQSTGILQDLKAKMRHDLLIKLHPNKENQDSNSLIIPSLFKTRIIYSLINEFLTRNNLNYTYSVFMNETKSLGSLLTKEDLLDFFKRKSENFTKNWENSKENSMLEEILESLVEVKANKAVNCYVQTEDLGEKPCDLQMRTIEDNYMNKLNYYKLGALNNAEEKLNDYKKNLESRFREDLRQEVFI